MDESTTAADDDHASEGGQDGGEYRAGDRGGHADLVEGRDDAEEEDEAGGDVGERLAVGEPAEHVLDESLDRSGDRGGHDQDDDRDDQAGQEADHVLDEAADRVGAEDAE